MPDGSRYEECVKAEIVAVGDMNAYLERMCNEGFELDLIEPHRYHHKYHLGVVEVKRYLIVMGKMI